MSTAKTSDTVKRRARRLEAVTPDHLPTCPKCGDLGRPDDTRCRSCRAPLINSPPAESRRCVACALVRDRAATVPTTYRVLSPSGTWHDARDVGRTLCGQLVREATWRYPQ